MWRGGGRSKLRPFFASVQNLTPVGLWVLKSPNVGADLPWVKVTALGVWLPGQAGLWEGSDGELAATSPPFALALCGAGQAQDATADPPGQGGARRAESVHSGPESGLQVPTAPILRSSYGGPWKKRASSPDPEGTCGAPGKSPNRS